MNNRPTSASTVAVVGAGHVGAAVAHTLIVCGTSERVVLYDRNERGPRGKHGTSTIRPHSSRRHRSSRRTTTMTLRARMPWS